MSAEAVAALTADELSKREGIGKKTVQAVRKWLISQGFDFRPPKEKVARPDARPWTDVWQLVWTERRGEAYRFDWWVESSIVLQFAAIAGKDLEVFRSALHAYHDAEDRGVWPQRAASLAKARHNAADWVNLARTTTQTALEPVPMTEFERECSEAWGK